MPRGTPFDLISQPEATGRFPFLERAFSDWGVLDWPSRIEEIRMRVVPDPAFAVTGEDQALFAAALLATALGAPPLVILPSAAPLMVAASQETACFRQILGLAAAPHPVDAPLDLGHRERPMRPNGAVQGGLPRAPDERCIALFTGGSTGERQLWWKTLDNLFSEAKTLAQLFSISERDVIVSTVPPCHIFGLLLTCLVPMVTGARVVRAVPRLPEDIASAVAQEKATVLVSVPAHYAVLRDHRLSRLRLALSSAAPLPVRMAESFFTACGIVIHEIFGSTETGGVATRAGWPSGHPLQSMPGVETQICDGRLLVRSPFLSPDLPRDAQGFYVTSDRARSEGNGFVVLGRIDGIVKVGGRRIDLVAIEEAFRRIQSIDDVLVLALPVEQARGTEIAALVATAQSAADLRRQLRQYLEPSNMPHRIEVVSSVPRTKQGKIDRDQALALLRRPGKP